MTALKGLSIQELQKAVESRLRPGQKAEVFIGLSDDVTDEQVATIERELVDGGLLLTSPVEVGTGPWSTTLRIGFVRPKGIGFVQIPLAAMLVLALGAVGVTGILGWKLGGMVDQVKRYVLPIALIAAGAYVLAQFARRPA